MRRHTPPEDILLLAGVMLVIFVDRWLVAHRIERYRARNAAGQCGHCGTVLTGENTCNIAYHLSKAGPATDIAVCAPCRRRYRWRRIAYWCAIVAVIVLPYPWRK
jgi:hypothetical protein